jgi:hypothetical protein
MRNVRRESGLSLWLFLFVTAVLFVIAVIGFRVLPAYIEYFSVRSALVQSMSEAQDPSNAAEVRRIFQRRVDAGYIESVDGRDIDLRKDRNNYVATIAWSRRLPLVANVSLLIDFETKAER